MFCIFKSNGWKLKQMRRHQFSTVATQHNLKQQLVDFTLVTVVVNCRCELLLLLLRPAFTWGMTAGSLLVL